jgi:SAM-dependent methyltransferase
VNAIWHDLECGGYGEDLALWRALAASAGDPVLEVGAGTGRVALTLARAGHRVTALDNDPELVSELTRRAGGMDVLPVLGDARELKLGRRFALCLVPMQTIQLLGGAVGRSAFLARARAHLARGGVLAIALADQLEPYEVLDGALEPAPDLCERDGILYCSRPTAVRADRDGFVLERRREVVHTDGGLCTRRHSVYLDRLAPSQLEREAVAVGLRPAGRGSIPASRDYAGSAVVMLRA